MLLYVTLEELDIFDLGLKKIFVHLILFLGICPYSFTQNLISAQIEAGVNVSGIPDISENFRYIPKVSPVLGYWTQLNMGNRFSLNIGAQYLKVGYSSYDKNHRENEFLNYTSEDWESYTLTKISVPLNVAYHFKIRTRESAFFVGVKRNYFLKGDIESRSRFIDHNDASRNSDELYRDDPFKKGVFINSMSRMNNGLVMGFSTAIKEQLGLNFIYSMRQESIYSRGCSGNIYSNNDLTLSLRYTLNRH